MICGGKGIPGAISSWTNNSRIAGDIPEIVLEAESWVWRRLRHWRMIPPPATGTMTIGSDAVSPPADFLDPIFFVATGTFQQTFVQKTPQEVISNWAYDSSGNRQQQQPVMYYFDQGSFRFDSPPDQAYPYALLYYQQPAPLAVSISNFLTIYYPRLLRCALMAAACEWLKDFGQGDANRTYWDELAMDEIEKAQIESDRAKRGTIAAMQIIGGGGHGGLEVYGGVY